MARVKRAVNAQKSGPTSSWQRYRGQRSGLPQGKEQMLPRSTRLTRPSRAQGRLPSLDPRINAAARANGMTYNRFIQGLKIAGVEVDRKVLSEIAISDPAAFAALVEVARANVPANDGSANDGTAA